MTRRMAVLSLLPVVAAGVSCGESAVGPYRDPGVSWRDPSPVLTTFRISPASIEVVQGDGFTILTDARDQRNVPIEGGSIVFTSSQPDIAGVNAAGVVTGISPGSAVIKVERFFGASSRPASMKVFVADSAPPMLLELRHDDVLGWKPNPAFVAAGGVVRWLSSRKDTLYLWGEHIATDSTIMVGGVVERTLTTAGNYEYCLGCWSLLDYGVIHVR